MRVQLDIKRHTDIVAEENIYSLSICRYLSSVLEPVPFSFTSASVHVRGIFGALTFATSWTIGLPSFYVRSLETFQSIPYSNRNREKIVLWEQYDIQLNFQNRNTSWERSLIHFHLLISLCICWYRLWLNLPVLLSESEVMETGAGARGLDFPPIGRVCWLDIHAISVYSDE